MEPLLRVCDDVSQNIVVMLRRKNTEGQLRAKFCLDLGLEEEVFNTPQDRHS